ncbi:hypothetical protein [Ralstonia pseudosolanacearum]|uniref:hypothetical protein n=1 Tax=Ralstonia pseudosolanacearum TaxID=1310165 RepID=UPI0011C3B464
MSIFDPFGGYGSPQDLQNAMYSNQIGAYQAELARQDAMRRAYIQGGFNYPEPPKQEATEDQLLVLLTGE